MELKAPAVKQRALELGVAVTQPLKIRTGELFGWLSEKRADVFVVLAYGRILPKDILELPPAGALNLHASLLPKYRGAAPIQWSVIRGEKETGISLMQMDEGLDTGPVLSRHALAIGPDETAGELAERLASLAAEVVRRDLSRAVRGELEKVPQDPTLATLAPPIDRELGRVDFGQSAGEIAALVRGLSPRPGAFTLLEGKHLGLKRVRAREEALGHAPGTLAVDGGVPLVATGRGSLEILAAQLQGKREAPGRDLVNGRVLRHGLVLGR